jgi:hypothetical protein
LFPSWILQDPASSAGETKSAFGPVLQSARLDSPWRQAFIVKFTAQSLNNTQNAKIPSKQCRSIAVHFARPKLFTCYPHFDDPDPVINGLIHIKTIEPNEQN